MNFNWDICKNMASWLIDIGQGVDGMGLINERQLINRVH